MKKKNAMNTKKYIRHETKPNQTKPNQPMHKREQKHSLNVPFMTF